MVHSACCVPGCRSGHPTDRSKRKLQGMKNVSLFCVPRDALLFEKWKMAVPKTGRQLNHQCRVCELHFADDQIERFFVTKLTDGTINKIERVRPILKSGAVPTIFSSVPLYLQNKIQKKSSTGQDSSIQKIKATYSKETNSSDNSAFFLLKINVKNSTTEDSSVMLSNSETNSPVNGSLSTSFPKLEEQNSDAENSTTSVMETETERPSTEVSSSSILMEGQSPVNEGSFLPLESLCAEQEKSKPEIFTFRKLLESVESIKRPTYWWCINVTFNFVACVKWNIDYVPEKRVIIENNLNCKIFLRNREICIPVLKKVTCIEDVSYLLQKVEGYLVCAGADDGSMGNCQVLLPERNDDHEQFSMWCNNCHPAKKGVQNVNSKNTIRKADTNEKLRQKLHCSERRNFRLRCKVEELQHQLQEVSTDR